VIYVLAIIVGVCALGAALVAFTRRPPRDDVERFHRARAMTTEWSRHYAATGQLELPDERDGHAHDQVVDLEAAEHAAVGSNGSARSNVSATGANGANGHDRIGNSLSGRRMREPVDHR
jgi:hypothetical protein